MKRTLILLCAVFSDFLFANGTSGSLSPVHGIDGMPAISYEEFTDILSKDPAFGAHVINKDWVADTYDILKYLQEARPLPYSPIDPTERPLVWGYLAADGSLYQFVPDADVLNKAKGVVEKSLFLDAMNSVHLIDSKLNAELLGSDISFQELDIRRLADDQSLQILVPIQP